MEHALHECHLLRVARRQLVDATVGVQRQSLREHCGARKVRGAVERGRVGQELLHAHPRVILHLGGNVPDRAPDLGPVPHDVPAEDLGAPRGGKDQVQKGPDGGGLSCAIRSDEPEDLPLRDAQIDALDPAMPPVILRKSFRHDRHSVHARAPSARLVARPRTPGHRGAGWPKGRNAQAAFFAMGGAWSFSVVSVNTERAGLSALSPRLRVPWRAPKGPNFKCVSKYSGNISPCPLDS